MSTNVEQESRPRVDGVRPRATRRPLTPGQVFGTHGLLILTILFIILFSILLPSTFPTALTLQAILSNQSTVALLALAEMIVIAAGQFDLSIGYGIGLMHILAVGLQVKSGLPWEVTVVLVLAAGAGIGLVNGLLVQVARIDSFIATLGVGTIVYGISNWYTNGQQIVGVLPNGFLAISGSILGVPTPALYVAVAAIGLWIAFEFLPVGRYIYALGSNPRAAELTGIPRGRYTVGVFVASGLLTAVAGIALAARLQVGQSNIGAEYLLPAFVGALLGATSVRPGRVNVWGTIVAVLILAVGISGIQQLGGAFFVEPLFNGTTLVVAVGLAGYASRRRLRAHVGREGGELREDNPVQAQP